MKKYKLDLDRHFILGKKAPTPKKLYWEHRPAPIMDREAIDDFDDTLILGIPVQVDWEHLTRRLDYHKNKWWIPEETGWIELSSFKVEEFLYRNGIGDEFGAEADRERIWVKRMFYFRDRKAYPMGELPDPPKPPKLPEPEPEPETPEPPSGDQLDLNF